VLLANEFIECARSHARSERRIIITLEFDVFAVLEKILHEGNYGARAIQAIAVESLLSRQDCLYHAALLASQS
jgi:hypothetical protein